MYGQFYILRRTAIVRVLVKMCQDCNTIIFIFAVFVVSLSLTPSAQFSVFYINKNVTTSLIEVCLIWSFHLPSLMNMIFYSDAWRLKTRKPDRLILHGEVLRWACIRVKTYCFLCLISLFYGNWYVVLILFKEDVSSKLYNIQSDCVYSTSRPSLGIEQMAS